MPTTTAILAACLKYDALGHDVSGIIADVLRLDAVEVRMDKPCGKSHISDRKKCSPDKLQQLTTDLKAGDEGAKRRAAEGKRSADRKQRLNRAVQPDKGKKSELIEPKATTSNTFLIATKDGVYTAAHNPKPLDLHELPAANGEKLFVDNKAGEYVVVHQKTGLTVGKGSSEKAAIQKAMDNMRKGETTLGKTFKQTVSQQKSIDMKSVPESVLKAATKDDIQPPKPTVSKARKSTNSAGREHTSNLKKMISGADIRGLPASGKYKKLKEAEAYAKEHGAEFPEAARKKKASAAREMLGVN